MPNTLVQMAQAVSTQIGDLWIGTATGGTATTLIDASDDTPFAGGDGASLFKDGWLHIADGTNAGIERRVSTYTPGSLQLTVGNAFPTAIDATSQYEYRQLFRRSQVTDAINRALARRLFYYTFEPIGLLTDADGAMEESGTSKWTGNNATLTKESSENDFIQGQQSLRLDALAAGAYAESQVLLVSPGEALRVEALVLPYVVGSNKSTASLVVYDQDNSAAITLNGTTTGSYATDGARWKRLFASFEVPAGCGRITFRLTEGTNGARAFWDELIAVRPSDTLYTVPSWVVGPESIEWAWERIPIGGSGSGTPYRRQLTKVEAQTFFYERAGSGFPQLEVPGYEGRTLYVSGYRNYPTLTNDASTTSAPFLWLLAASIVELLEPAIELPRYRDETGLKEKFDYWSGKLASYAAGQMPDLAIPLRLSGR